jgi:homogentisate 1,2-dioxygenase
MPYYRRVGEVPRKRHTAFRQPDGELYLEELVGSDGFSAESSLLYHRHSPSAIVDIEHDNHHDDGLEPNVPLVPHHFRTHELDKGHDIVADRTVLMGNDDITIAWATGGRPSSLYRDAVGDELVYVQEGRGRLDSVFGSVVVGAGDYVVVPCGVVHRWVPEPNEPFGCFIVMSRGHIRPPKRYLSPGGQFIEQAIYCERDQRGPTDLLVEDGEGVPVLVRHRGGFTRHHHAHHPFDVVGWDGCMYPWALNIHDIEPIVGSVHQPPPVHQTFEGQGFVVCSFVPRPFDFHPEAIKVPYHHSNVDSDEVLFYSGGDFMSRAGTGIGAGSITLHPAGFVHGPQPGSVERSMSESRTEETAVMIDTFAPLQVSHLARLIDDRHYAFSWAKKPKSSAP